MALQAGMQKNAAEPARSTQSLAEQKNASGGDDSGKRRRPNVLIIMTDQHRRDYMSTAGASPIATPNIDRIAARGVRFTNAICPYPVCAASRMSLMTGLYPHSTGVIDNSDCLAWNTQTIASYFGDLGYHTGLIGKMHFNDGHHHGFDCFLGFNDWFMYLGPRVARYADAIANEPFSPRAFDAVANSGAGLPELPAVWGKECPWAGHVKHIGLASEFDNPEDEFEAFVSRESRRFLERYANEDSPFLLVASFLRPHPPSHPPREWANRYRTDRVNLPPVGDITRYPTWIQNRIANFQAAGSERMQAYRAAYWGNLAYVDTCIGEVYFTLERLGLEKDTIVIYTADHGEMDGDHGLYEKFCFFDPSIGVPLIVSQPGRLPEGKTCNALVEYFGIFPTIADLTGTPPPGGIEAKSFAAQVWNPGTPGEDAQFAEYNLRSMRDCYMVRTQRYKYNYSHNDSAELYDLEVDPDEKINQAGTPSFARIQKELHDRLMAWYSPTTNRYRLVPEDRKKPAIQ